MPQSTETILALIQKDIANIKGDVNDIKTHLETNYVTKEQFQPVLENHVTKADFTPVRAIVFGAVSMMIVAIFASVINSVVLK